MMLVERFSDMCPTARGNMQRVIYLYILFMFKYIVSRIYNTCSARDCIILRFCACWHRVINVTRSVMHVSLCGRCIAVS